MKTILTLMALTGAVLAEPSLPMPKTIKEVANLAQTCEFTGSNGATLPYRMISPELAPGETCPLVVFLHGAGERGTNNQSQLVHAQVLNLTYTKDADGVLRQGFPRKAFYIFPQCAGDSQWVLVPWGNPTPSPMPEVPSPGLQNVHELVAKLKTEFPIDPTRIYVTGMSMGGYGTWDYLTRWPEEVAAAIVICGGASNDSLAANPLASTIPVRIFHGALDTVVPTARGRSAFDAIKAVNGKASYTEYGKEYHGIWGRAYEEPNLGEWLFQFHK